MTHLTSALARAATFVTQSAPNTDTDKANQATQGFDSGELLPAAIIFGVALVGGYILRHVIERAFRSRNAILARLAGRSAFALTIAIGLVYALSQMGIRVGLLLGALGIGGFALAFALRDTLENLISGIILQVRQPFGYDDTVEIGDYAGSVDDINLRSVEMTTFSGEKVIIPSATVLQNPIENWTGNAERRLEVDVGVSYDVDVESVCEVIQQDLVGLDGVLHEPAPDVVFAGFGSSSVNLKARVWFDSDGPFFDIQRRVAATVKRTVDREAIDMPFPTRTLLAAGPSGANGGPSSTDDGTTPVDSAGKGPAGHQESERSDRSEQGEHGEHGEGADAAEG